MILLNYQIIVQFSIAIIYLIPVEFDFRVNYFACKKMLWYNLTVFLNETNLFNK